MTEVPGFSTRAIHAGQEPDPAHRGGGPADLRHLDLRPGRGRRNPRRLRVLPLGQPDPDRAGGVHGRARGRRRTGSPSPAGWPPRTPCCARSPRPGSHVVLPHDAYGGTYRLFARVHQRWGVTADPAPLTDLAAVEAAIGRARPPRSGSRRPTNPLLAIADIAAIAELAHAAGALVVVDNTFATPVPAAAARARRRRGRALDHQVLRRPLRCGRRRPGGQRRRRWPSS